MFLTSLSFLFSTPGSEPSLVGFRALSRAVTNSYQKMWFSLALQCGRWASRCLNRGKHHDKSPDYF